MSKLFGGGGSAPKIITMGVTVVTVWPLKLLLVLPFKLTNKNCLINLPQQTTIEMANNCHAHPSLHHSLLRNVSIMDCHILQPHGYDFDNSMFYSSHHALTYILKVDHFVPAQ